MPVTSRLEDLITRSRRLSARTKKAYLQGVASFVEVAPEAAHWTPAIVETWIEDVASRVSPQTANLYLRGVQWASRRRAEMDSVPDFAAPVEGLPTGGKATRTPRALSLDETERLLATCPANATDLVTLRDRMILLFGLNLGLRREEMCGITWGQWSYGPTLRDVLRKGGHRVLIALDADTVHALARMAQLFPRVRWHADCPILQRTRQPIVGAGRIAAGLTTDGIYKILAGRAKQAGLKVAPHELRHTFGSDVAEATKSPMDVARALGHSDLKNVGRYFHTQGERGDGPAPSEMVRKLRSGK